MHRIARLESENLIGARSENLAGLSHFRIATFRGIGRLLTFVDASFPGTVEIPTFSLFIPSRSPLESV